MGNILLSLSCNHAPCSNFQSQLLGFGGFYDPMLDPYPWLENRPEVLIIIVFHCKWPQILLGTCFLIENLDFVWDAASVRTLPRMSKALDSVSSTTEMLSFTLLCT